ncbi:hypothetical protein [Lysobacter hankyongensis]|uniref:DUF2798 domain-containing protein n=1 Tax=Lysobacter hankyongensis TaxID=1176535 RepID=A0ABP9AIJ0_9GAMM
MSRSPRLRLILVPALALGVIALVCLGILLFGQAAHQGRSEALMMAWVLAFVVGLPVATLALAAAGAWSAHHPRRSILPNEGVKIP